MAKYTLEDLQEHAIKNNGKCTSTEYIGTKEKYGWYCNEHNYHWRTTWTSVNIYGTWCKYCAIEKNAEKLRLDYDDVVEDCLNRNIEFLDDEYISVNHKHNFRCKICNYKWSVQYGVILYRNHGCARCAGQAVNIKDMHKLAADNNGECLSEEYINDKTELLWKCKYGHIFKSMPRTIKNGSWCSKCSQSKSEKYCRKTIEELTQQKFPKRKPKWLLNENGNRLELDGYNEELKIAFEYQGEQHYLDARRHTKIPESKVYKTQKHDQIKRKICKKKDILLLEPNYTMTEKEILRYFYVNICKWMRGV